MAISRRNALKSLGGRSVPACRTTRRIERSSTRSPKSSCPPKPIGRPPSPPSPPGSRTTRKAPTPITATATRACGRPGRRRPATTRPSSRRSTPPPAPAAPRDSPPRRLGQRRAIVEAAILDARVERLPARPTGAHIATDLMGHYFNSSVASDLCYRAAIGRDACRGLPGSEKPLREPPNGGSSSDSRYRR